MVAVHAAGAVAALVVGATVLATRKGTRRHRWLGWVYAAAMAVMSASSFGMYELRDGPSQFHAVSVIVLVVVAVGLLQPIRRRHPAWRVRHLVAMQISYLLLVVTGVTQFFDTLPLPSDALNAIVFLQIPMVVGVVAIAWNARRAIAAGRG